MFLASARAKETIISVMVVQEIFCFFVCTYRVVHLEYSSSLSRKQISVIPA